VTIVRPFIAKFVFPAAIAGDAKKAGALFGMTSQQPAISDNLLLSFPGRLHKDGPFYFHLV